VSGIFGHQRPTGDGLAHHGGADYPCRKWKARMYAAEWRDGRPRGLSGIRAVLVYGKKTSCHQWLRKRKIKYLLNRLRPGDGASCLLWKVGQVSVGVVIILQQYN